MISAWRLEQANQLLAARHRLAGKNAALGLGDDALDQRQIMPDLAEPELGLIVAPAARR